MQVRIPAATTREGSISVWSEVRRLPSHKASAHGAAFPQNERVVAQRLGRPVGDRETAGSNPADATDAHHVLGPVMESRTDHERSTGVGPYVDGVERSSRLYVRPCGATGSATDF